ncbi:hypothetical protein Ancab_020365 [Ancistrocladus abbreviatus]
MQTRVAIQQSKNLFHSNAAKGRLYRKGVPTYANKEKTTLSKNERPQSLIHPWPISQTLYLHNNIDTLLHIPPKLTSQNNSPQIKYYSFQSDQLTAKPKTSSKERNLNQITP